MSHLVLLALLVPSQATTQPTLDQFSASLKAFILQNMPKQLYEKSQNWDHQEISPKLKGLRVVHVPRNDGTWRKIHVTPSEPNKTLEVRVYDLKNLGQDRVAFKMFIALDARMEMEKQIWESGHRLYSGSLRARARIKLDLDVQNRIKVIYKGGLLPDVLFRLKVTGAKVSYDHLVVEHIGGVGGTAARLTGEALRSTLKQWKPSIERDLLKKASAAILKAGDTREIRLGLSALTTSK